MSYVKHILLPDEQVLYDGHVHPSVLVPGALLLGFAAWMLMEATSNGEHSHSLLLRLTFFLADNFPSTAGLYNTLEHWQERSPNTAIEVKIIAGGIALWGFNKLMQGLILMQSTELIVTDLRVIAKAGLMTITTVEMDRRRIAGVTVYQTFIGRIMGYGNIYIQGFTSSIGGLPVMVNPHLVERFLS